MNLAGKFALMSWALGVVVWVALVLVTARNMLRNRQLNWKGWTVFFGMCIVGAVFWIGLLKLIVWLFG